LPIELVFTRDCKYTLADALEQSGLDDAFIRRDLLALGLPYPADDELLYTDEDLESFRAVKQVLDTGLPEERMLELARIAGRSAGASRTWSPSPASARARAWRRSARSRSGSSCTRRRWPSRRCA